MIKHCGNCVYNAGELCKIWLGKQVNCISWADEEEAQKREDAIKEYELKKKGENKQKVGKVRKILKKNFNDLYNQGSDDFEISKILKIPKTSVGVYRRELCLKINTKECKK